MAVLLSEVSAYPTSNGSVLEHALQTYMPMWPREQMSAIWADKRNKSLAVRAAELYLISQKFADDLDKVLAFDDYKMFADDWLNGENPLVLVKKIFKPSEGEQIDREPQTTSN